MAKSIYDLLGTHKVLEFNKSVGLKSGHVEAQTRITEKDAFGTIDANNTNRFLDNGTILYLDIDGKFKFYEDLTVATNVPFVVFSEELFNGYSTFLKHYTNDFLDEIDEVAANGRVLYPRGIALYVGDVFTTDNFTGTFECAKYAILGTDGVLALSATLPSSYEGPLFAVEEDTLPDGITDAAHLTVIATDIKLV